MLYIYIYIYIYISSKQTATATVADDRKQKTDLEWCKNSNRLLKFPVIKATLFTYHALQWRTRTIHTHIHLMALCPGLPGRAGTRKVKPIWILLKQATVSGSGISRDICKSATRSRQITMPAPHHSVFYRMPFLPPNQQRQSTEGTILPWNSKSLFWCNHSYLLDVEERIQQSKLRISHTV